MVARGGIGRGGIGRGGIGTRSNIPTILHLPLSGFNFSAIDNEFLSGAVVSFGLAEFNFSAPANDGNASAEVEFPVTSFSLTAQDNTVFNGISVQLGHEFTSPSGGSIGRGGIGRGAISTGREEYSYYGPTPLTFVAPDNDFVSGASFSVDLTEFTFAAPDIEIVARTRKINVQAIAS